MSQWQLADRPRWLTSDARGQLMAVVRIPAQCGGDICEVGQINSGISRAFGSKVAARSYLEAPRQELVLHLQEVALVGLRVEGLVDDGELRVVLDVLPPRVPVAGAWQVKDL